MTLFAHGGTEIFTSLEYKINSVLVCEIQRACALPVHLKED